MKKRSGLERAIWILAVLDIVLLAAFLVLHITDTRVTDKEGDIHAVVPIVTDARAPEDASLKPGEAEKIVSAADTSGRSGQMVLEVGDKQIEADLVSGSFQQRGGPDFSLYIDADAFRLLENEGRCYVAAAGDAGTRLYLELSFFPNADAASVASKLLDSYGAVTSESPEKTEVFGGYSALRVTGSSAETDLEAFVVSVDSGCLTAVFCCPGYSAEGKEVLHASLDSLVLNEPA